MKIAEVSKCALLFFYSLGHIISVHVYLHSAVSTINGIVVCPMIMVVTDGYPTDTLQIAGPDTVTTTVSREVTQSTLTVIK